MEPTLKLILFVFLFYSLLCLLPLISSFSTSRRWELMVNGAYLIFLASFVLTGLALVTGVIDKFSGAETLTTKEAEEVSNFMQYIIFGGFIVSFIFGSVGANVFSAGLLQNNNHEILRRLDKIEHKIDQVKMQNDSPISRSVFLLLIKIIACFGALFILWWAL